MLNHVLVALARARGRSVHELVTRSKQAAYAWSERARLSTGRGAGQTVRQKRNDHPERLFAQPFVEGFNTLPRTVGMLRQRAVAHEHETIALASAVARGQLPILGHGLIDVGVTPLWTRDPLSGITAPALHWSTIPILDRHTVGDHKVVWEINRHQYFLALGQAWQYTRDNAWAALFATHVRSWIAGNAPTIGMNWASSLEVSYRAIAWVWAIRLMRDAPAVDAQLLEEMSASLNRHGRHLERYLSTYFSPNTHLTGEALGLFYIGTQCPELPNARRWARLGADILEHSLARQVLPDGVYFEQATQYHRYTVEIYVHYVLLARATSRAVSPAVEPALQRLFDVLLHLARNDGTIPLIGDDDGGRLLPVDIRAPHDVRSLLAVGAVMLQRSDLAWLGQGDDVMLCWLLGSEAPAKRDALVNQPPTPLAVGFPNGGTYVMRDGWNANDGQMVIDGGPHGALSFGHSHSDALSVELSVGGHPLFVDAGTYTYVGDERDAFRVTRAHNTVEIDNESACIPGTAFRWRSASHTVVNNWVADARFTYFSGSSDAYGRLPDRVVHHRSILHAERGIWIVRDDVRCSASHDVALRWRCAPGLRTKQKTHSGRMNSLEVFNEDGGVRATLAVASTEDTTLEIEKSFVSPQFGCRMDVEVCVARAKAAGNITMVSVVIDAERFELAGADDAASWAGAAQQLMIRERGIDGRKSASSVRTVLIGGSSLMTFGSMQLDAKISVLTLSDNGGATAVTAVGVRRFSVADSVCVENDDALAWIAAERSASDALAWKVRTSNLAPDRG